MLKNSTAKAMWVIRKNELMNINMHSLRRGWIASRSELQTHQEESASEKVSLTMTRSDKSNG